MKRALLAILFVLIVAGAGYGLYVLFFQAPAPPEIAVAPPEVAPPALPEAVVGPPPGVEVPAPPPTLPPGVSPVARGGVTLAAPVSSAPTVGASISSDGSLSFYNNDDGRIYRLTADGTVRALTDKAFRNVERAVFDPAGAKAVLEFPDGANIFLDLTTGRQATLPKHWEEFEFSGDGNELISKSIGIDEANRFLVVSNPDGSAGRAVQEMGRNADKVTVTPSPAGQIIATAETGQSFGVDRHEVFFLGKNQENFKSMVVEGLDFRPLWTPAGNRLLYSVAGSSNDWKPRLWIVDAAGDAIGANRRSLPVNTWADKCAFADDSTLFCAVPTELQRGAGLQPAVADSTPDTLVRIDLATGSQTTVAVPDGRHTVDRLMVAPDGSSLFFTDKGTGILNKVRLK